MRKREKNWIIKVRWVSLVFVAIILCTTLAGFFCEYITNKRLEAEINKISDGASGEYDSTLLVDKPFKQLSADQFKINNENQTISFSEDIQEGTFCVTQNPEGPDANDVWQPIVKNSTIKLENLKDDDLTKVRVYYLAVIARSMTNYNTSVNAYTISTAAEMTAFAAKVNAGTDFSGKTVYLMANITLPSNFTPIGTASNPFKGTFNGNGYTISEINMQLSSTTTPVGLFGTVTGGTVKNVTIKGTAIKGGGATGGIVGNLKGNGLVENCINEVPISGTDGQIGGIVGMSIGTVRYCQNKAAISSSGYASGGIVGRSIGKTAIYNCKNTGKVEASGVGSGGILGYAINDAVTISNCTNSGTINANERAGGIAGGVGSISSTHQITYCKNTGIVKTTGEIAGGIVGNSYSDCTVQRCINTNTITSSGNYAGGIVAYSITRISIIESFNEGAINAQGGRVGGIVGYAVADTKDNYKYSMIYRCANKGTVNGSISFTDDIGAQSVGGVVGYGRIIAVKDCCNTANITGKRYAAGIVGAFSNYGFTESENFTYIIRCMAGGNVSTIDNSGVGIANWVEFSNYGERSLNLSLMTKGSGSAYPYKKYKNGKDEYSTKNVSTGFSDYTEFWSENGYGLNGGTWWSLKWQVAPTIIQNPFNVIRPVNTSETLEVVAYGAQLTYQWYKAESASGTGTAISGATSSTYKATVASTNKWYYCVITGIKIDSTGRNSSTTSVTTGRALVGPGETPELDETPPTGTVTASTTCTNQNSVTIYVKAQDELSGIKEVTIVGWTGNENWVSKDTVKTCTYNSSTGLWEVTYTFDEIKDTTTGSTNQGDAKYYFGAHIFDKAENKKIVDGTTVIYDTTPPVSGTYTVIGTTVSGGAHYVSSSTAEVTLNFTGLSDNLSGLKYFDAYMKKDGAKKTNVYNVSSSISGTTGQVKFKLSGYGTYVTEIYLYDKAGNSKVCLPELTITANQAAALPKLMERDKFYYDDPEDSMLGARRADANTTYLAERVRNIRIINLSESSAPSNYEATWDVSYMDGDGTVTAWVVPNAQVNGMYDLYIGADDIIQAPENSDCLFAFYTNCESIEGLENLSTTGVTSMNEMFARCNALPGLNLGYFDTSSVESMYGMFENCLNIATLDLCSFDTSAVTDMNAMFCECENLLEVNLSSFNTSKVTNMYAMFKRCYSLEYIDITNFDTSIVGNIQEMFCECSSLETVDLSHFATGYVTDMDYLFQDCTNLKYIDLSSQNFSAATPSTGMFQGCESLESLRVGPIFTTLNWIDAFKDCNSLKAIISTSESPLFLVTSGNLGALSKAILYVPSTTAEAAYEAADNYDTVFGADRIKPILELTGKNPAKVYKGATYVDAGVTVAGMTKKTGSTTYTPYGYTVSGPVIKKDGTVVSSIDTTAVGSTYTYTYTIKDSANVEGMSVTRDVVVKDNPTLMEREYGNSNYEYYAIGASRVGKGMTYTAYKIRKITLLDLSKESAPTTYIETWDVSYTNGDGDITAWLTTNAEYSTMYDLYLGAEGKIYAPSKSDRLFRDYNNCIEINGLNNLDTSKVTNMSYMFYSCDSLTNLDVSGFNTSKVTNMYNMFSCERLTNLDVSGFDTSKVTNMGDMFFACKSLTNLDVSGFNTSNVTNMRYMFGICINLTNIDVSGFDTSNVTDMCMMFDSCRKLTQLDVSNFDTAQVTNITGMFDGCSGLTSLDVSHFNTSSVIYMSNMFDECSGLTSLDVSHFDTSKVTDMYNMFNSCSSLTNLDVGNFDTSNVTKMNGMFSSCSSLTNLDVSGFNTSNVKTMGNMFSDCTSLENMDLRNFDTSSLDGKTYNLISGALGVDVNYMFSNCTNLESVIIGDKFNRLDGYDMFYGCKNLKAIITTKAITTASDALTLSGTENVTNSNGSIIAGPNRLIGLPNAILYVPNTTSETAYEVATNYDTVFGADRIRPILELVGDNPAKASIGAMYVDSGVTVAGMTKNADGTTYTPYGYTVSGPVIKKDGTVVSNIDTNTKGTYTYTYTIKDSSNVEGMSVTRDVIVKDNPRLMQREHDNNYQYYAIGAYRADNSTIYTADKIKKITLIDLSKESAPTTYVATWDASYTNGDGDVTAWLVTNAEDSTMYDLYIGADDITIVAPANSYNLFGEYKNCTAINNLTMLDTSNVTSMGSMFYYCSSLTSLDVSNFDTSKVTNMSSMFSRCSSLPSLDVSNFDTSQVTNMSSMFSRCSSLTSLAVSNFNTSNVINMGGMFLGCSSLPSLAVSNFDTSNVTNMDAMFYNCSSLPSLDVSNFNTSNVTNMGSMFYNCSSLPSLDLSKFNTSNVTNMSGMFSDCSSLSSLDVSKFDTAKVTSMRSMFSGCIILPSLDVSKFNTSKVTNMGNMFYNCRGLPSLDVSNFNTSNVINMVGMFSVCISLPSLDVSNFNTSNVTNMEGMFSSCSSLASLDVSSFDTSKVTNMSSMFFFCRNLPSLDVSNFDTSNVTNMVSMFSTCSSLASLDVSSFDTSNVTNMYRMFYGCSSLPSLDVSSFDTSNVTNMDSMFYGCSSLTSINLGTSFDKLIGADMFKYCSKLKAIITPRANSMTLNDNATTSTGLKTLTNAILYVPSIDAEATFEAVANYADILGADRIRPILELLGDNPVKVSKGATYVDSGVTVAGMTKNADGLAYTPYGYTVSGPVIKKDGTVVSSVDTSNVGTYTLTYTVHEPNSSLDGMSVIREVEIESKDISENNPDITVSIPTEDRVYRDAAYTPVVTVKDGTTTLVEGTDYSVSYSDNINAGMATVTIKGINNYTGTRTENFMITQRPVTIKPKDATKEYDTLPLTSNEPEVTAGSLVDGHTATITTNGSITSVESITNTISTLTIENASGTDVTANYNVTKAVGTLTVTAADNVDFDIILDNNSFVYDGTEKEPGVTIKVNGVTLEEGKDYDVSYKNNKDAGTATVTITGKGNYEGSSSTKDFTITKRPLEITAGSASKVYNGTALTSSTFSITSGTSLAPNQTLSVTTSGTITNVGTTSNVIATYTIYQNGENVTANYSVTLKEGILEVKPATITGSVIITGTNRVGKTLTAEVTVDPNDASLTYAWYYGTTKDINNATAITGANAKTYSPTTDKIGMYIFVKVTATKANYDSATFNDITDNENNKVEKVGDRLTPYLMAREVQTVTSNGVTSEKAGYAIGAYRAGKTKYTSDLIKSVTIINLLETNAPTTYEAMWDASRDEDEAVFVWAVKNQTNSSMYDLYIGGEGTLVLTNGKRLFADYTKCEEINGLNKMNSTNVTDMSYMFSNLASMSTLDVSVVNTSSVTNMEGMFMTNNLTTLNVSGFDTSKVTNMSKMFKESSNLTSLNINGFNTANANNMSQMFMDCGNITSLNVSAFNTSNVTNMSAMFMGMSKIETLNVTNFNTVNVTDMSSMFASCLKVQRLDLHTFNTTKVTNISGMFTAASSMKSVLLGEEFNKLNGSNMFTGCSSLKAIIAQKKITAASEAMTLSATGTGLNTLTNAVLYVPNLESKGYYETATNYATVFGEARVKPILEIIGANPVHVTVGKEYVDQGAKVAGFEESEATEYTVYGYTLSVSGLPVDTSTVGTKLVIYTVKYKDQVVVTGATW